MVPTVTQTILMTKVWQISSVEFLLTLFSEESGLIHFKVDQIQLERFQLPQADEIFAKLKGAQFFTTLDATSGF